MKTTADPGLRQAEATPPTADDLSRLNADLSRWIRWLRLQRGVIWAARGLVIGLSAGLAVSLAALILGRILRTEFLWLVGSLALAGMAAGGCIASLWPISRLWAARYFDLRLNLRERVSTSLEVSDQRMATGDQRPGTGDQELEISDRASGTGSQRSAAGGLGELYQRLFADALAAARQVNVRAALPLRAPRMEILLALILAASVLLSLRLGETAFRAAASDRAVEQAISDQTARIEEILAEIEQTETLTGEQRHRLARPLEQALQQLQEAQTLEQAVSILTSTGDELDALSSLQAAQQAQALREAGELLGEQTTGPLDQLAEDLASEQVQEAAEDLQALDPSQLSQADQEALAGQLEQAAGALSESQPELAGQLQTAAQALRAGDAQAAQQALQAASQTLAGTAEQLALSEQAGQAAEQVAAGRQRLLQQANESGDPAAAGEQQANTGTAPGEGSSPSGTESGPAGSGAGRGEGNQAAGAVPAAGPEPIQPQNGPGDGGERPYEPVYAPQRLGGTTGEDVTLPGSGQTGDETTGASSANPDQTGQSQVPYADVYQEYADAYRQAIESGQVPGQFRDLVRDYFSSLEP